MTTKIQTHELAGMLSEIAESLLGDMIHLDSSSHYVERILNQAVRELYEYSEKQSDYERLERAEIQQDNQLTSDWLDNNK